MMFSATDFLPDNIKTLTNLATSTLPNFGSGRISRLGTSRRRGISIPFNLQLSAHQGNASLAAGSHNPPLTRPKQNRLLSRPTATENKILTSKSAVATAACLLLGSLRTLGAVLGTRLLTVLVALRIQRTAHQVITHTRLVFYTATTDQHDTVLLQVVALAADIRNHFETVGQTNFGNLTQSRVRLLRGRCINAGADAAFLRAVFQRRRFARRPGGGARGAGRGGGGGRRAGASGGR